MKREEGTFLERNARDGKALHARQAGLQGGLGSGRAGKSGLAGLAPRRHSKEGEGRKKKLEKQFTNPNPERTQTPNSPGAGREPSGLREPLN